MHRSLLLVALLVSPVAVSAQEDDDKRKPTSRQEIREREREKKAENLEPYEVSDFEKRLLGWEKKKFPQNWLVKGWRGFRPVFGGMPSGSGTVIGGGYIHGLEAEYFQFQANARWSTEGYMTGDAEVVLPPPQIGRRVELKVRGEYRDLTALSFYGIGNDSSLENESSFLLNDKSATAYFWLNPRGLLSLGVQGGFLSSDADRGTDAPSIGVVAPLWLRAKCAYGGGRGMFEHEVSQALPVQAREAEEVPRSQLGGIQRRAAPPGRFDSLV